MDNVFLCSVRGHAERVASYASAAYWCEAETRERNDFLRANVLNELRKAADVLGYDLVKREPSAAQTAEAAA